MSAGSMPGVAVINALIEQKEVPVHVVAADMGTIMVRRPRVVVQVAGVNARKGEDLFEAIRLADASVAIDLEGRYPVPNVVSIVENLMESTSPSMRLPRTNTRAGSPGAGRRT